MKIYINRVPVDGPWGGGNHFVKALWRTVEEHGKHKLLRPGETSEDPDVIMLAGLDSDGRGISADQAVMYRINGNANCRLVVRINENDARKGTNHVDGMFCRLARYVDGVVFVSHWLKRYYERQETWPKVASTVIHNGVDRSVFRPGKKLDNGKLNLVTHHWSDNFMKGFDYYDQLDALVGREPDRFTFTYIGRERGTFKHTRVVPPLFGLALGEELGRYDAYISASRFDPGPNHVLEALACGLPTFVYKDGGGCIEFAGESHVFHDMEDLLCQLEDLSPNDAFEPPSWETSTQAYIDFMELIGQRSDG